MLFSLWTRAPGSGEATAAGGGGRGLLLRTLAQETGQRAGAGLAPQRD